MSRQLKMEKNCFEFQKLSGFGELLGIIFHTLDGYNVMNFQS